MLRIPAVDTAAAIGKGKSPEWHEASMAKKIDKKGIGRIRASWRVIIRHVWLGAVTKYQAHAT